MMMIDIIRKKRDGETLTAAEIEFWINGCVSGQIPEYQTAALLMAIWLNGFSKDETVHLTKSMCNSGDTLDLSDISGIKADKHSSGGVGDKTSLIIVPIIAAAGIKVAKLSGRGLGHTGGTRDKLESISGFSTNLSNARFKQQINDIGMALSGQSGELVPADKILYALRDVTATVDSIPLIAASIMSKKLATGADILVLDVKYGSGALMKDIEDSRTLANTMVDLAYSAGIKASAVLSSMEQPLGMAVGNSLEIIEVIDVLEGKGPSDLRDLALALAGELIYLAGIRQNRQASVAYAEELLNSGIPREKFSQLVAAQGGDIDFNLLPQAAMIIPVKAQQSGYICEINAEKIGYAALSLGAGRQVQEAEIDHATGIVFEKKCGANVNIGDVIANIHCQNHDQAKEATNIIMEAIKISVAPWAKKPLIAEIISR